MNKFEQIDNIFVLGVGGIGISALARYFNAMGKLVAGYDLHKSELTEQLKSEGISITYTDSIDVVPSQCISHCDRTLVIYTPAIPASNQIFSYFKEHGYQMLKRAKVLGMIADNYTTIAISGTHGKTTNSCVMANIIKCAGKDGFAFLGGISCNINSNLMLPEAQSQFDNPDTLLVAEADEFDRSFLWLSPKIAVVTYVDADHLDIYKNRDEIVETFNQFVQKCRPDGTVIINQKIAQLIHTGAIHRVTYSDSDNTCDYYATNIRLADGVYTIDAVTPKGIVYDVRIGARGRVNVENTMACIAAAQSAGIPTEYIKEGIATFAGVKRRMEFHVNTPEVVYIDDYAHHPREIAATIQSVRELYPGKKLTGIFQPHLYTRTRDFADGFAESLSMLDEVILMEIYPAREQPIPGVNSQMIANRIKGCEVHIINDCNQIIDRILQGKAEVLLTLGAGSIDRLVDPITKALRDSLAAKSPSNKEGGAR
ncbi:MAG: UDP-N-acetylmuramate--L-alanine ligase [Bacteroidales bacterium]|nr:UDP-N-acetylmuramate--L-alanine ligase [Bacteroidales bacterium]